jgi:hypothetical protein
MNCLKGRKHICARVGRKSHVALKCCWEKKMLLLICAKTSQKKDVGQP